MLTVEEALERCLAVDLHTGDEEVPLHEAHGRVLAEPVVAPIDMPRWDNSAMDGYAVRAEDTEAAGSEPDEGDCCTVPSVDGDGPGVVLRVVGVIPAGSVPEVRVEPGTAARIMTGAPVPEGADAVVMREHTDETVDGLVRVLSPAREGQHIRRRGEEIAAGTRVLDPGVTLGFGALGLCAAMGRARVRVRRRPRVAIVSTGDEVVAPGEPLEPGQIWSSNTAALVALVREAGGEPLDCGIARDDLESTRRVFRAALDRRPDLLVSTGGVSVGDFDVVKRALAEEGAEMRFWRVRVKPGKPLAFGLIGGVPAFGLAGNPVSTMVGFLQFVRPVIRRALGDPRPFLPVVDAILGTDLRRKASRPELLRVALRFADGHLVAEPARAQGSGMVGAMARAHGLLLVDGDTTELAAGSRVPVQVFDPSFLAAGEPGYRWA